MRVREEGETHATRMMDAKKFAREVLTACNEPARDESIVSISYHVTSA